MFSSRYELNYYMRLIKLHVRSCKGLIQLSFALQMMPALRSIEDIFAPSSFSNQSSLLPLRVLRELANRDSDCL
jgi:hypothetical protein